MILSGWKAIAGYLGCGVRTVQRWEQNGLPVNRPAPGNRSHVVARSEDIDVWIQQSASRANKSKSGSDLINNLARLRRLRQEVKLATKELQLRLAAVKKELAEIRRKRRRSL